MRRGTVVVDRIEAILKHLNWGVAELAKELKVSRRAVEFWLDGRGMSGELLQELEKLEDRLTSSQPQVQPVNEPGLRFRSLGFSSKAFAVRKALHMSQHELGNFFQISGRTYGRLESGDALPSTHVRKAIMAAYRRLYVLREDPAEVLKFLRGGEPDPQDAARTAQQPLFEAADHFGRETYITAPEIRDRKEASHLSLEIRRIRGIRQIELATMLDINQTRMSRIEQCRINPTSFELETLRNLRANCSEQVEAGTPEPTEQFEEPDTSQVEESKLSLTPQRFSQLLKLMEWLQGIPVETVDVLRSLTPLEWEYLQGALP